MPKLLAIASTLTVLTVLAISGTAFASDHRHGATPSPKAMATTAAPGVEKAGVVVHHPKHPRPAVAGGSSVPTPGKTTQQK
jgi:hypothetical protein